MEKIHEIREVTNEKLSGNSWTSYEGFQIQTDLQLISIFIENEGKCCERSGYVVSEDDLSQFQGAEIREIVIVDTALNTKVRNATDSDNEDKYPHTLFVNVETNVGLLQFALYNMHNGYYGHDVRVVSKQLLHSAVL